MQHGEESLFCQVDAVQGELNFMARLGGMWQWLNMVTRSAVALWWKLQIKLVAPSYPFPDAPVSASSAGIPLVSARYLQHCLEC